jgi:hypothetical protein
VRGLHRITLRGPEGVTMEVVIEIRARRVHVCHPSASSGATPPWTSRCCTSPSGIRRADVSRLSGSS